MLCGKFEMVSVSHVMSHLSHERMSNSDERMVLMKKK